MTVFCRQCKKDKPETEFYASWLGKQGKFSVCIECAKEYNRKYYETRLKPKRPIPIPLLKYEIVPREEFEKDVPLYGTKPKYPDIRALIHDFIESDGEVLKVVGVSFTHYEQFRTICEPLGLKVSCRRLNMHEIKPSEIQPEAVVYILKATEEPEVIKVTRPNQEDRQVK